MTARPVVAGTREELAAALAAVRSGGGRVALVPTMGALHAGHASLIATAEGLSDGLVVSIFVNPTQFAPGEDLDRYPRTFDADLEICAEHGVDVVFAPSVGQMYPGGDPAVTVAPGPLGSLLEGAARPTHFAGVLTVVAKLLGLVRPDVAVFGEKDYQQLTLIRRMVLDLCLGVDVVGSPTVREPDGLALSSRNRYLDADQRAAAVALSAALRAAQQHGADGPDAALAAARQVLDAEPGADVDYLELLTEDLAPLPDGAIGTARMVVAARVGSTRLLDNLPVRLGTATHDAAGRTSAVAPGDGSEGRAATTL